MRNIFLFILIIGSLAALVAESAESKLKLSGRKDRVLPVENRVMVLEVAREYLQKGDDSFVASVDEIETPFLFEQPEEAPRQPTRPGEVAKTPEPEPVEYDDATVLDAVASSFARQVRGTMARGDTRYLQLQGGSLLKSGTTFPARLPEIPNKTFEVTISEITSGGYTLTMGEASVLQSYEMNAAKRSGAITVDGP